MLAWFLKRIKIGTKKGKARRESGQTIVLFVVAASVLLGFTALTVDVGLMAMQKSDLQKTADAAALAGAQELPDNVSAAKTVAKAYAVANGNADDIVTVSIPMDNLSINVKIESTVPMHFAGILGHKTSQKSADATAKVGIAASVPWIVPFVVSKPDNFNYDNIYVMRMYGKGPYPNGYNYPSDYRNSTAYKTYPTTKPYPYQFDYMNVKIEASSNPSVEFQDYLNYLKNGYKKTFSVSQKMLYYAPSSGGQQSVDTFATRIANDPNTDYKKAKIGDSRVMLIPIVSELLARNAQENTKVTIIGFVGFYLSSIHKNTYGNTFWFEGRFLKDLNIGTGEVTYDTNADFGLRVIKLAD